MNIFKKEKGFGAEIDFRSPEEQLKDYKFEETVSSIEPVKWVEKDEDEWKSYPIYSQNGSGSCVAQTMAKMMGIMHANEHDNDYVPFSATDIYQRRSNKPNAGMSGIEVFKIAQQGVTLESLVPSQNMTDAQMDSAKVKDYERKVGDIFKIGNYITIAPKDIETVASVIQKTGKPVMVWFYFESKEWTTVPEVKNKNLDLYASKTARHSVTAVDFTLYKGKKALIIEDSWGTKYGKEGRRIITEDFFKARNWFCAYAINFNFDTTPAPKYTFKNEMFYGQTSNEIAKMQDKLKSTGDFPTNIQSTGYYGNITAQAVYKFQVRNSVASMTELDALQGKVVGQKTLKALNK